jgi:hypothetical protein
LHCSLCCRARSKTSQIGLHGARTYQVDIRTFASMPIAAGSKCAGVQIDMRLAVSIMRCSHYESRRPACWAGPPYCAIDTPVMGKNPRSRPYGLGLCSTSTAVAPAAAVRRRRRRRRSESQPRRRPRSRLLDPTSNRPGVPNPSRPAEGDAQPTPGGAAADASRQPRGRRDSAAEGVARREGAANRGARRDRGAGDPQAPAPKSDCSSRRPERPWPASPRMAGVPGPAGRWRSSWRQSFVNASFLQRWLNEERPVISQSLSRLLL